MASDEPYTVSGPNSPQTQVPVNDWAPRPRDLPVIVPPTGEEPEAVTTSTTRPTNRSGRAIREIVETLLLAAVIFVGVRLVVLNFRVDGHSMDPNLDNQEMLLVNRNAYVHFDLNNLRNLLPGKDHEGQDIVYPFTPPERGDIIVFNPPVDGADKPYIKRVIGLPGDHVTFQKGEVIVNGQQLDEPYIKEGITNCRREEFCDVTVPAGDIFALGDNRQNSSDSRVFGPVKVDAIIGKAWFAYWPMDDVGLVPHFDYPNTPER